MTTICLLNYSSSYSASLSVKIDVSTQSYKCSNLFQRYEHKLKTPTAGEIYLYKGSYYLMSYLGTYATLKPKNGYESSKLDKVSVYVNRFDSNKSFLILVFCFTNGGSTVQNKYYSYSELNPSEHKTMNINSLTEYKKESDILCPLLQENDILANVLTYDIMRTTTNTSTGGGNGCTYNCGKIQVTDTSTNNGNGPKLEGTEFKRFKHAPTSNSGGSNGHTDKSACIIYRCQTLVGGNGGQPEKELAGIQNQKYTSVKVYFGCRAKRPCKSASGKSAQTCSGSASKSEGTCPPASTCKPGEATCTTGQGTSGGTCPATPACSHDVPLLLELHKNGASSGAGNPEYYVHRRNNGVQKNGNGADKYYWVQLPCDGATDGGTCANGGKCTLKNLLEDIGLYTTKNSGAGHETLQKMLQQASINNGDSAVSNGGQNLCELIKKANGDKLQKLLGQPVNGPTGPQNGDHNHALITLLLQRIQFDIIDSLVILLDKNCKNAHNGGQNGDYGDSQISSAIGTLEPSGKNKRINVLKVGNGTGGGNGKQITVKCVSCSTGGDQNGPCKCLAKCLKQYGYCVIEHDFATAVKNLGGGCSAGLRLLIPTKDNNSGGGGGGGGGGSSNGQNKYQELHLYSSEKTGPEHLLYLYYQNGGAGSEGSTACTTAPGDQTCDTSTAAQTCSKLYVVFYHGKGVGGTDSSSTCTGDPRPLLLCYNGCWYRPKDKGGYFSEWVQIPGVDKTGECSCSGEATGAECKTHQALLTALTRVVGFLNQVNLWQRPNGTAGEAGQGTQCPTTATSGQGTCSATAPGAANTCNNGPESGTNNNTCKYEVHTYTNKKVQVQVTCCPVNGTTTSSGCYKKLTHKPAGLSATGGDTANGVKGFRLGNIVYCGNGCTADTCKIDYYNNGGRNGLTASENIKYAPLVSVTAYFYNEDKSYCDPLLVELQFKKNGANGAKEYYQLTKTGSDMTWAKDDKASSAMSTDPAKHLDGIRYCLKQAVRIHLEKNKAESYALVGRKAKPGTSGANGFTKINGDPPSNGKQIRVEECQCPALASKKYACFRHDLTNALKSVHYQVAGLVFTLPGNNGGSSGKVVEIPLYAANGQTDSQTSCPVGQPGLSGTPGTCPPGSKPGTKIDPLTYNKCMGDICVYFYAGTNGVRTGESGTDTVPLMLRYNGQFYKPESRDQYFDKWVCIKALAKVGACGCCATEPGQQGPECTGDCCTQIANQLDSVNECLNRIDLDKSRLANGLGVSGQGYGLPPDRTATSFKTERVTLTKQEGPQQPPGSSSSSNAVYTRVVHRTQNGFRIGDIKYCGHDFATNGVNLGLFKNGQTCTPGLAPANGQNGTITVSNGPKTNGHKTLVTEVKANTVVVYYSKTDECYRLPQLIVILHTDKVNSTPVTVSGNKYGYYVLSSASTGSAGVGGSGYEYQWRDVNGTEVSQGVTLDDESDFRLLNAAIILMERRIDNGGNYNESEISQAVTKAGLASPGNTGDVNRLTGKEITVKDESETGGGLGTHECLKDTGFKVMTHNLDQLVKLNGPLQTQLKSVTLITGLKFVIPGSDQPNSYKQVNLCPNGSDHTCSNQERHYYINGNTKIHVLFYGSDPRPLILCCNGNVYIPKDKTGYNQQHWHKTTDFEKCVCNGQVTSGDPNEKLLKALVTTVGFLNKVELQQHPGMSKSTQTTCENGQQGPGTATECTNGAGNTCKYEVHKFNGKPINVQVKCCPVSNNGGQTCYSKFTHSPAGMDNGAGNGPGTPNNGFRLGDIVYCGNGCTADKCKLDYYNTGNNVSAENKWKPLILVSVYYYNEDGQYCDPLLVILEFKNGVAGNANDNKEYYKLKTRNGSSMDWEKDQEAKCVLEKPDELVKHLDSIRLCLKQVVRIHLEYNGANGKTKYALMGRSGKDGGKNGFNTPINGTAPSSEVTVDVCECPGCTTLSDRNYKCFKHKLVDALANKQRQVAGLVFTLPEKNGPEKSDKAIEIPLIGAKGQKKAQPSCPTASAPGPAPSPGTCPPGPKPEPDKSTTLLYNKCMGNICVYFYGSGGGEKGDQTDTVPLMLQFNGQFYKPENRDCYFDRWVCVADLCSVSKECGCSATEPGKAGTCDTTCCTQIADQLDSVNEALNRIDLDPEKAKQASSNTGYGLPDSKGGGKDLDDSVGNVRVTLKEQTPTGNGANAYKRIIHRTKNGFRIGDIKYCGQEIVACGITPKGQNGQTCTNTGSSASDSCPAAGPPTNGSEAKITVAKGAAKPNGHNNHKTQVKTCQWNTVVVYYSCTDTCMWLPQLIVVLKTDKVDNGVVTGSASQKKYGYYILATKNGSASVGAGGSGYQYTWRTVNDGKTGVTLNDETDFLLLNAAIILLEWRNDMGGGKYGEDRICQAIKRAIKHKPPVLESPGNTGDVNRLTGKQIIVTEEQCTDAGTTTHTCPCPCKCLTSTGFKVMTHDLTPFVKLNGPFKDPMCNINLITGLKLLIPTAERGKYKQVQLQANGNSGGAANGSDNIKYHKQGQDKVCVYFYDKDPRPLLVSYNGWAYRAKSKDEYDQQKWTQCTEAAKCQCTQVNGKCDQCPLLKALVQISDFLNPVNIKQVPNSTSTTIRRFCHHYRVHRFNGQRIWIRVTSQPAIGPFCFHRYTHSHAGITGKGDGFRLGNIWYGDKCITENGSKGPGNGCISASDVNNDDTTRKTYKSADSVVVFYYKLDKNHANPIVVAMCSGTCESLTCNLYYVLKSKKDKKYDRKDEQLKIGNDDELSKQLDDALFGVGKKLQIVLSKRPEPTEYKPGPDTSKDEEQKNRVVWLKQDQFNKQFEKHKKDYEEHKKEFEESDDQDNFQRFQKFQKFLKSKEAFGKIAQGKDDALFYHVKASTTYNAQLSNGPSEPSSEPTQTQITVTQVTCDKLYSEAGYRCFKHDLVNANEIESVGGLVLCVFAKQTGGEPGTQSASAECAPCDTQGGKSQGTQTGLELCDGQATTDSSNGQQCTDGETGCKNGQKAKNGKKVDLHYNVCKGNLYVFFYGEDPRPLMLCYNNNAYRPLCMADYCKQWVRVSNGATGTAGTTNCRCDDTAFDPNKLLPELYRVSVFLNPVYLCLTCEAVAKLRPKGPDGQSNGQPEQTCPSGPNGPQAPSCTSSASCTSPQDASAASNDYTYPIDTNPSPPVRVRVTATDLHCYRQYTHKTEHEGFRLGVVTYEHPKCDGQAVQAVQTNGQQCPAQVPASPGPTATCTSATTPANGFCFPYESAKQLQTVSTYYYMYDWCHSWPLVVELGFKGRPSEWWRLCSKPANGSPGTAGSPNGGSNGSTDSSDPQPSKPPDQLKWVKMGEAGQKGDTCQNGQAPAKPAATQGNGQNCPDCPPPATGDAAHTTQNNNHAASSAAHNNDERQETCARDAQFARSAQEIQAKLGNTVLGIPVYPRNYPGLEIDLQELIEGRAYEIRKALKIEYGSKDTSRLIMKTDSNCYEESIMAYLVGGGVLGAAGGGGWKFVTMVTGVAVAL